MKLFGKKRQSKASNTSIDTYNPESNSERVEIESIIKTYELTPVPYEESADFANWKTAFLSTKEAELENMNIDIECFDIFVGEIKSHVLREIVLSYNQYNDHNTSIKKISRNLEGKKERFMNQKAYLEEDIKEVEDRLSNLNDKKKLWEEV
ncbi:MAG: hypothetical protein K6E10_09600 [Eubacterium sp.]|nr:hypothetical protein [Eubacterium sp.]